MRGTFQRWHQPYPSRGQAWLVARGGSVPALSLPRTRGTISALLQLEGHAGDLLVMGHSRAESFLCAIMSGLSGAAPEGFGER